jgi:hypothetical protein
MDYKCRKIFIHPPLIKKVARAQGVSMAELIRRKVGKEISLGMITDDSHFKEQGFSVLP